MALAGSWNLNWRARIVIACSALAYLMVARPWDQSSRSVSVDACACAGAMLTLALIPKGTRWWLAIGTALVVALLIGIVSLH